MKLLIGDKFETAGIDGLKSLGCEVAYEPAAGAEGLAAALERARPDVLIVRSSKVPAAVIQGARGLKAIIRAGAGVDNIDVAEAKTAGISVANCPGMNSVAVAELAMGLLLACDRRIVDQTMEIRAGRWNKKEFAGKSRGLKGATLLIVGLGAIGKAVARRALAFEMGVLGWDALLGPRAAQEVGVEWLGSDRASLLGGLARADAVSVHLALVPPTKHFCNAEFFGAMKTGACFINTSRGGIVDESALCEAVKSMGLRLGLDVYEGQPATPQGEFSCAVAAASSSAFTHHCGASTEQAQQAVAEEVVRLVKVLKETGRLENAV
jgi:D-3-phosphoglycerate dehydrogenase